MGALISFYRIWKRNTVIRQDFKEMKPLDPSYDTYIPVEQILDRPVPSVCRRIIFKDEFGRSRTKLLCGNTSDAQGLRVYYNN